MRLSIKVLFLLVGFILLGCKKDQLKSHIVNVKCNNVNTGTDVQAQLRLWVSNEMSSPSNNIPSLVKTTVTDLNGFGQIDFQVIEGRTYWVEAFRTGFIGSAFEFHNDSRFVQWKKLNLDENQSNVQVDFDPFYSYQLHAVNLNCSGATDSLWIENPDAMFLSNSYENLLPIEAYGCADTSYLFSANGWSEGFLFANTSQINVIVTTKKQGVVSSYTETFDLTLGTEPDQITIEY